MMEQQLSPKSASDYYLMPEVRPIRPQFQFQEQLQKLSHFYITREYEMAKEGAQYRQHRLVETRSAGVGPSEMDATGRNSISHRLSFPVSFRQAKDYGNADEGQFLGANPGAGGSMESAAFDPANESF